MSMDMNVLIIEHAAVLVDEVAEIVSELSAHDVETLAAFINDIDAVLEKYEPNTNRNAGI